MHLFTHHLAHPEEPTGCAPSLDLLPDPDPRLEAAIHELQSRRPSTRIAAVRQLGDQGGAQAVRALSEALRDREAEVRIAAAEALGRVGDRGAIQPLAEALRACFVRRSAALSLLVGILAVIGAVVWGVAIVASLFLSDGVVLHALDLMLAPYQFFADRRKQGRVAEAIAGALQQVAERHPAPELVGVVQDLRVAALDTVSHSRTTREASRAAARRIEELTEQIRRLPLAGEAPTPEVSSLPIPGHKESPPVQ